MSDEVTRVTTEAEMDAADRRTQKRLASARSRTVDTELDARIREYLGRPYRMEVRGEPKEGYLATAPELLGCVTAGETPERALAMLRDAMAPWLEAALVAGDRIPEPGEDRYR